MSNTLISVEVVPHEDQRYNTVGDWAFEQDGSLNVNVSKMNKPEYELLVGIHEIVEAILCRQAGISQDVVDQWDFAHDKCFEPGDVFGCPYGKPHMVATFIEMHLAQHLDVRWSDYCAYIERLGESR